MDRDLGIEDEAYVFGRERFLARSSKPSTAMAGGWAAIEAILIASAMKTVCRPDVG
jgi:hypothetical protein